MIEDISMGSESTEASLGEEGLMDQASEEASPKASIRVLYVDDEPAMLDIVKRFLEAYDPFIVVYAVVSAEEALDILERESFDCIVSDYNMPGMNGVEFANEALKRKRVPFIIYTGKGSDEVAEAAIETGVDDYLRKELGSTHYKVLARRIITTVERHRAQRELLESEAKYRTLLENDRDGIAVVAGPKPKIVYANSVLSKMLGYSKEELTSFTASELKRLVHPDDIDTVLHNFETRLEGGETTPRIYRLIRKNGDITPLKISSNLIEEEGKPALQAVFIEYVGPEKIEAELEESRDMYRSLIELAPDGIITFNLKGFVKSINPAYTKLTGFSEDEIVDRHFTKIGVIKAKEVPKYLKIFTSLVRGRQSAPIEFEFSRKDGSTGWGEAHFSLIRHKNNKREILAIARDITDRKRADEKLRVVGKLSRHDVRNKLSVIMGYVDLTKMNLDKDEPIEKYLESIRETTYQIVNILNFAADYERLGIEEKRPIKLSESFRTALSMFSVSGIEVDDRCEEAVVLADSMISRVFYNFIDNSLKHGKKVSKIILYVEKKEGLKIIYQDNGIGIPAEKKKRIFEGEIEKTGVHGLNLINKIIESYGWTIREEGRPGEGVRFVINIPDVSL